MTANVFVVLVALVSGPLTAMIIAWERDRSPFAWAADSSTS